MTNFRFKHKKGLQDFGWHDRGFIPHFDGGELPQFVTFRLSDSMPQKVLDLWTSERETDAAVRKRIETYLDSGHGECWLSDERVAEVVSETLMFHEGTKYRLHSWVVMPNHVHALITPLEGGHLPAILHSIKSFTAGKANKILGRNGQFWQPESFDRYIRNYEHFVAVVRYIENNPVKAGLCKSAESWQFSSAYERSIAADKSL